MCGRRDKCSIKRSVLGAMCKLGSNVKIINSVLMDSVVVHDGCHLQNCIVCTGAQLQASILKLLPCHITAMQFLKQTPASSQTSCWPFSCQLDPSGLVCRWGNLCLLETSEA